MKKYKLFLENYILEFNDNENFKKWFGNSKVVENGKPRIVYHGTGWRNIDVFDFKDAKDFKGIWFTSSKSLASEYGRHIYPVYLRIEKPYIIEAEYEDIRKYDDEIQDVDKSRYDGIIIKNADDSITYSPTGNPYSDIYIVFNSNQIKSVKNNGEWSIDTDNIYETKSNIGN